MKKSLPTPHKRTLVLSDSATISYSIRESRRAKHVLLKFRPIRGLEVVIPVGFDWGRLPDVLQAKKSWIEAQLAKAGAMALPGGPSLPDAVFLRAVGESVPVVYEAGPGESVALRSGRDGIYLRGAVHREDLCRRLLREDLKFRAREILPPWLERLGRSAGLSPRGCSIRLQKTRWGSCSAKGSISLNAKLLLTPPELTAYILMHELAHLKHPNHAPAYWRLVETLVPDYRIREAELRQAWRYIPAWVEID